MPTRTPEHRSIQRISTVCRRLDNVHPTTLYRWEQKGQFPKRVTVGPNMVGWYTDENRPMVGGSRATPGHGAPVAKPKGARRELDGARFAMTATELATKLQGKPAGDGWVARCPAHEDRRASLSIGAGDDGKVLLKCFAGCSVDTIVAAMGLKLVDVFPPAPARGQTPEDEGGRGRTDPSSNSATVQHDPIGCTLASYAAAKHLPIEKLPLFGLTDITYINRPAIRIPYRAVDGQEQAVRIRVALNKGPDGDQRFVWRRGSKVMPYGLDRLADARSHKYVALVEGESDSHTLWCNNIPAIGLPGASTWKNDWTTFFDGIEAIYVVIEPDHGGDTVLKWLAHAAIRDRVRLVRFTDHKDVSELWIADPDRFMARWDEAMKAAEPWASYAERQVQVQANTAWAQCAALASEPDILLKLDDSLARRGVVGERRAARLVYLSATSRTLDRPVSIAVKGPSSGGKSHVVQQVLDHFPPEAYYALSAMSERALAYSEEPLKHRMFVIYEAVGMSGDFASYLIRSLLSEGCVRYETVEKTPDGIRPRLIEREGPTGLITTTTAVNLHPENETRMLSIPVTDTPDQTREILRALSEDRGNHGDDDLIPWRTLQTWLASAERRAVVPYARRLAEKIPPVAIRLRRDFTTLLTLIKSHAVLHQASRERDAIGRVVATLTDYQAVRDLVLDLFDVAVQATVSDTVRETVAAVVALTGPSKQPASLGAVAKRLNLDKGTVSRRVKVALSDGYLHNLETKRNQPMKLVGGDPLPDAVRLLPEPASLDPSCTVAVLQEGIKTPLPPLPIRQEQDDDVAVYGGA
jgi:hypothetical protein